MSVNLAGLGNAKDWRRDARDSDTDDGEHLDEGRWTRGRIFRIDVAGMINRKHAELLTFTPGLSTS